MATYQPAGRQSSTVPGHSRLKPLSAHPIPNRHRGKDSPSPVKAASESPQVKLRAKTEGRSKLSTTYDEPPEVIVRDKGGTSLTTGKLLGEGGFARVYAASEHDGTIKAVKVVAKTQLKTSKNRAKLFTEIKLHQAMAHENILNLKNVSRIRSTCTCL